jgi:hypothetical protein
LKKWKKEIRAKIAHQPTRHALPIHPNFGEAIIYRGPQIDLHPLIGSLATDLMDYRLVNRAQVLNSEHHRV